MPPSDSRFRSFAERYVIERSRNWPADGTERNRAWDAMLDARGIYDQIDQLDKVHNGQAGQGAFNPPTAQTPRPQSPVPPTPQSPLPPPSDFLSTKALAALKRIWNP